MRRLLAVFALSAIPVITMAAGRPMPGTGNAAPPSFPPAERVGLVGRMFNDIPIATGGDLPEVASSGEEENADIASAGRESRSKRAQKRAKAAQGKIKETQQEINKIKNTRWWIPFASGNTRIKGQSAASSIYDDGKHWRVEATVPNFGTAPGIDVEYTTNEDNPIESVSAGFMNEQIGNFSSSLSSPSGGQIPHNLNVTNTIGAKMNMRQIKLNRDGTAKFTGGAFAGADLDQNQFASVGAGTVLPISRVFDFNLSGAFTKIAAAEGRSAYSDGNRIDALGGVSAKSKIFGLDGRSTLGVQFTEANKKIRTVKFDHEVNYKIGNNSMTAIFNAFRGWSDNRNQGIELSLLTNAKKEGKVTGQAGVKAALDDTGDIRTGVVYRISGP